MDSYADGIIFDQTDVCYAVGEWLKVNGDFTAMDGQDGQEVSKLLYLI